MNIHNELFNVVRQLRWQHISPVVSTFSIRLLFMHLFHKALSLSVHLSLSVVPHPVFLISGIFLQFMSCRLLDEACTVDDLATVTAGKGMRPQVGENGVKDTTEEEESRISTVLRF